MKKLKRIAVGQLGDFEKLSKSELMSFVGGSGGTGCVWACLAWIRDRYDGNQFTTNKEIRGYEEEYRNSWKTYMSGHVRSDGDPAITQKDSLFDFISQRPEFSTTTESWETSKWGAMISSSGEANQNSGCSYSGGMESVAGNAIVVIGTETDQHALVIYGQIQIDYNNGKQYYNCYDPEGKMEKVYVEEIKYGTGVSMNCD